jgi:hypothetical protein
MDTRNTQHVYRSTEPSQRDHASGALTLIATIFAAAIVFVFALMLQLPGRGADAADAAKPASAGDSSPSAPFDYFPAQFGNSAGPLPEAPIATF